MDNNKLNKISINLKDLIDKCHGDSQAAGWWKEYDETNDPKYRDYIIATKICLIHSEVSEALEAYWRDKMDDHLPHIDGLTTELADVIIRVMDLVGKLNLPLEKAIIEKNEYNNSRKDHKPENRVKKGGKKF